MQVEQDDPCLSATPFSNELSHQGSQSLPGSWLVDRDVDIYTENPDPIAYDPVGYDDHRDSHVNYAQRPLNDPVANTNICSALYQQPAQHFTENPPVQTANDMNLMANSLSDHGGINYASTNHSRSELTFPYAHPSSQHSNSTFPAPSDENTDQSFSHQQSSIQFNSFESDNTMTRSTARNPRDQAPPDTSFLSRASPLTPSQQSPKRGRKFADGTSQGKPSETNQARECKARKLRGSARKGKNHAALQNFRISKRRPSKKPALNGKQDLHHKTIAACSLWLSYNPGKMPSEHEMSCLSVSFGGSIEPIRNWFMRNMTVSLEDEDTGYQTMRISTADIASLYRGNRGCERKATSIGVRAVTSIQIPRNEARPFACTSRCGKSFKTKANWERHEEKNRVQRLWICGFQGCRNKEGRKRVWLNRKEHYVNHVSNHHPGLDPSSRDIANCYVEMESNFDKHCIFSFCNEIFHSWKERISHIGKHFQGQWKMSEWRDMDEEEEETDATDSSEDGSGDSESEDLGDESDSDDTDYGAPGPGPSDSSYDHGADRLDGHPGSSAQRPGSNSNYSRYRGGASTGSSKYDCMTHGCQADPLASSISTRALAELLLKSRNGFSALSQARSRLHTRKQTLFHPNVAAQSVHLQPLRFLGRGSSAIVEEVKMKGCEVTFARKRILSCAQDQKRSLHREATIMARLKHPHIIRLVGSYQQMNSINYLTRPVADCNLLQYMTGQYSGSEYRSEMQGWFSCLASGLQYLHNSGIRHRDIKPSNMLLRDGRILYTDFGSSNMIPDDDSSESDSADFTPRYAAPEVFRGHRGRAADVFALGCVFLEIFVFLQQAPSGNERERTYHNYLYSSDVCEQYMSTSSTDTGKATSMSPSGSDMSIVHTQCKAMMGPRPEQRPTAAEIARRIPARVCCEEQLDTIPWSKPASDSHSPLSRSASDRTVMSQLWSKELISLAALLASTSHTDCCGAGTILGGVPWELSRIEKADPALKVTRQYGMIKKRSGEEEKFKEAVILGRTKRLKSMACDEIANVPRAVPLLVNSNDDDTLSDSSCATLASHERNGPSRLKAGLKDYELPMKDDSSPLCLEAKTCRLPSDKGHSPALKSFLNEQDAWQELLVLGSHRTGEMRRSCVQGSLDDVKVVGVDTDEYGERIR